MNNNLDLKHLQSISDITSSIYKYFKVKSVGKGKEEKKSR